MDHATGHPPSGETGERLAFRVAVVAVMALAITLRCFDLSSKNIWLDEAASWSIVAQSWPEFWRVVVNDIHPPLYF